MEVKPQQVNIEIGEKEAEGIYSNLVMIAHSPTEIVLDFARIMPGAPKTRVQARIIMTPTHAKLFHKTLEENLRKYEQQFGEIKLFGGSEGTPAKNIGFESPSSSEEK
ncbi:MAG: DUF3467 domain-containing protein [candidate division Zixibacteria bacterium]|nr:DUF3467 domain-containing protein [candidate division Zixibacteria bacterium]